MSAVPKIQNADEQNTIRIMLATDNHIGYMERDPVRGQDSINTFREILQLALKKQVDFILLAGDLFHENKPSRECLYKTMALLREYTLSDRPVQVELLSDPDEGKADGFSFPAINYEDPNFNIGIPVFSIHGNHDDPQGAGIDGALCALDLLSVSGLVNYMGKIELPLGDTDGTDSGIVVRPVLLRKGTTHLGLYGIGNVKDQRMHFELRSNNVRMYMPRDKESWFNILLVHQNRVKHAANEWVPEGMFDDAIDLVVWGHEHDCRIVPEPVEDKNYYITQPGSSIATSLADGEALPKHVALLEISGKEFKLTPLPLRTVRPFVLDSVVLKDEEDLDLSDQMEVAKFLRARINKLIADGNKQWDERTAEADAEGEEQLPRMLPLVRLKVDTTGLGETFNPIRFGQEFQGRVANPRDVLVFHRTRTTTRSAKVKIDQPELSIDNPDLDPSERLTKVRVGTLVKEYLSAQELQLLGESGMSDAIQMYVEKDDIHAISSHVSKTLKALTKGVQTNGQIGEDDLDDALLQAKENEDRRYAERADERNRSKGKEKTKGDESDKASIDSMAIDDDAGSDFDSEPVQKKKTTTKKTTTKKSAPKDDDSDLDSDPRPKKKPAAKKAAPKKPPAKAPAKGRRKKADTDEDDDVIEIDDDEEEEEPKPVKRTNRAAVLSQPAKKPPAKKAPTKQSQVSFAPSTSRTARSAATKAQARIVIDDSD